MGNGTISIEQSIKLFLGVVLGSLHGEIMCLCCMEYGGNPFVKDWLFMYDLAGAAKGNDSKYYFGAFYWTFPSAMIFFWFPFPTGLS